MASTKKSNLITNFDLSALATETTTGKERGNVVVQQDTFEVAAVDFNEIGDIIKLARLPSQARPISITIWSDELDTNGSPTLATDLGIYLTDGTVKDVNAFASAYATSWGTSISSGVELLTEASENPAATATITITDYTELNSTDKINLVAYDGTNYDFVNGDQSSVAGTWESTTSNDVTATNLMNVINTSSGPAGTRFTASVDGAVVTVTQATAGAAGNTAINLTDTETAGMTKTDFTGGADAAGAKMSKALWEWVGETTDPGILYDISLTVTTIAATGAAGTISFVLMYVDG